MASLVSDTVGSGQDYATPSLWQSGEKRDLVAADEIAQFRVVGEVDVGPWYISNSWTTDATRYIHGIYESGHYHGGVNGTGATLTCTDSSASPHVIHFSSAVGKHMRLTGIRFRSTRSGGDDWGVFLSGGMNTVVVERCIFADGLGRAVQTDADGDTLYWINSISAIDGAQNQAIDLHASPNLVVKVYGGIFLTGHIFIATTNEALRNGYDIDIRNCLFADDPGIVVGTDNGDPFNAACDQNIFAGTSGTDRGLPGDFLESVTFQAGTGGSGTRVMLEDLTGGAEDFHLIRNDDNAAQDYGNDLSAVAAIMDVDMTLDLDEVARPSTTWDAGPDETVVPDEDVLPPAYGGTHASGTLPPAYGLLGSGTLPPAYPPVVFT